MNQQVVPKFQNFTLNSKAQELKKYIFKATFTLIDKLLDYYHICI